jgi:hypothetical protein
MTCGPRTQTSPSSPASSSSPVPTSTSLHSVLGTGGPIMPGRLRLGSSGVTCVTGLASVMP